VDRLERPQLWLDNGVPAVLFCAVKDGDRTFNVHIPLMKNAVKQQPNPLIQATPDGAPDG
jgi:hypothetical protein